MSLAAEALEVNNAVDVKAEVRFHEAAMTGITTGAVDKPSMKSAVEPFLLSPGLFSGHGEFVCTVCGEKHSSLSQLAKHIQFHDHDRPFPCKICGKRFLSRSHHSEHQRVHTGERPFTCKRCDRSFTTHHNLKRHMHIHNKEERYRCTVCGVLFCQEHQLGNISSIIRVLKQHDIEDLIKPEELLEFQTPPQTTAETLNNCKLKTEDNKEQSSKKRKYKNNYPHLDQYHSSSAESEKEGVRSQLPFHSEVPQVHTIKENLVQKPGPKIQKIAYDIEIIV
ncbi:zinc finger protein 260-like [Hoplias malabaricus]|uniref:zinc finger protein 260-like n=1 Tax=Hoplias malabaricus TaxID=27720 RepID=UPI00346271FC